MRTEVNEIVYLCSFGTEEGGIAELIGVSNCVKEDTHFRKYLEVNGKRIVVVKINGLSNWCGIEAYIPNSIERIEANCFFGCKSLSTIIFEADPRLREIGEGAFRQSNIKSLDVPRTVENIGESAFRGCSSICSIVFDLECKVKELNTSTFEGSSLKSVHIPKNIEKIGGKCFSSCASLREVIFHPDSKLREISEETFLYSSIVSILIPKSVTKIGKMFYAFHYCSECRLDDSWHL
jgi:hypothetical protein